MLPITMHTNTLTPDIYSTSKLTGKRQTHTDVTLQRFDNGLGHAHFHSKTEKKHKKFTYSFLHAIHTHILAFLMFIRRRSSP